MVAVRYLAILSTASATLGVCGAKNDELTERIHEDDLHPEIVRKYLAEMDRDEIYSRIAHARNLVSYNQSYFDGWVREGEGNCTLIGNPTLERSRGNLTRETEPFEAWLCDEREQPPSVYMLDEESFTVGRNCTRATELCGKETLTDEPMTGGNCIVTAHVFRDGYEAPLRDSACDPDMGFRPAPTEYRSTNPTGNPAEQPDTQSTDVFDIDGTLASTKRLSFTLGLGYTASLLWWIL
eukprot:scaffold14343_cov102-Cylindrotheca_fusiformis.AAC.2